MANPNGAKGSSFERLIADALALHVDDRIDRRVKNGQKEFVRRLAEHVAESATGCWEWNGYRYGNGYAAMGWQGKQQLLHRLAYTMLRGEIPAGLTIDHLCRVRHCVNPWHMEPVTGAENTRRAMRTHCVNGHEFTEENTYRPADGKRYCRECRRRRVREQRERSRAV